MNKKDFAFCLPKPKYQRNCLSSHYMNEGSDRKNKNKKQEKEKERNQNQNRSQPRTETSLERNNMLNGDGCLPSYVSPSKVSSRNDNGRIQISLKSGSSSNNIQS